MTQPASPTAKPANELPAYYPALDGLRGLAILWVLMHNVTVADEHRLDSLGGKLLVAWLDAGWASVTLFFALSGFLITSILLDTRASPDYFRRFYRRRVLRIFPLYYAVLIGAFVVLPLFGPLPPLLEADRPHQIWLWLYLSNWVTPFESLAHTFPHFWSLAVEEQFYLLWPLLIRPRNPRGVVRLCLVLTVAAGLFRIGQHLLGAPKEAAYLWTFARMDALALGAAAAAVLRIPAWRDWALRHAWQLMLASLTLLLACLGMQKGLPPFSVTTNLYAHPMLAISFALLVLGAAAVDVSNRRTWWAQVWRVAPLRVLAKYSYGMYVIHKLLGDAVGRPIMRAHPQWLSSISANLIYSFASLLATLALAYVSYHLLEQPFLKLKSTWGNPGASGIHAVGRSST